MYVYGCVESIAHDIQIKDKSVAWESHEKVMCEVCVCTLCTYAFMTDTNTITERG